MGMFNLRVSSGVNDVEETALNEHTDTQGGGRGVMRVYCPNSD